jgi:hypothetical protein
MSKKKRGGPQTYIATGIFGLQQRHDHTYVPMLHEKIEGLQTRIEDKQLQDSGDDKRGTH